MNDLKERPLVTFALFAYNHERFIREAVESALAQDYSRLQIVLSDDASTDDTYKIMAEIAGQYGGHHQLICRRNKNNLGLSKHINLIVSSYRAPLFVVAAGDDVSMQNRVSEIVDFWIGRGGKAVSMFSSMREIDVDSRLTGREYRSNLNWPLLSPINMIKRNIGVFGASHAWSLPVMDNFPPLHDKVVNEDVVIPFRASLLGGVEYIDKFLVDYRANIGLASNYSNGSPPSRSVRRSHVILRRSYVAYVQKCSDINILIGKCDLLTLAKSRRADHLFRYWLVSKRRLTKNRILFFLRRCRLLWLIKEFVIVMRF